MGGYGVTGSADSLQVGVTLGYPSGRAGPLDREEASATDVSATAGDAAMLVIDSSEQFSLRQPPTVTADTTAAAISPTHVQHFAATSFFFVTAAVCSRQWDFYMAGVNIILLLN